MQDGLARDWYPSGAIKGESHFHDNVLHGTVREYDENGILLKESYHEYGILVERGERSANGEMVRTFRLDPGDHAYNLLERYRREKGWPAFE
jgi:antitoxin component YwqK of YwqJK toxin-antitoxin module